MEKIRIDDIEDPRIDAYRNVRDADLIRDRGSFMIEGRYILEACARGSRYPLRSVFLNEPALDQLGGVLDKLDPAPTVYVAPQAVMDGIVGFHIHRGCLAEGVRPDETPVAELLSLAEGRPILVLEDLTNHDNVGGIFRSGLALGAGGVILTERTVDPLYRKAIRVSMGACLQLPWARTHSATLAIEELHNAGYRTIAMTPDPGAHDLRRLDEIGSSDRPSPLAIVLGTEGAGLSASALSACAARVRIDIDDRADSLNVTTAATVALYELSRRTARTDG